MKRVLIGLCLILFGMYGIIRILPLPKLAGLLGGPLPDYGVWSMIAYLACYIAVGIGGMILVTPKKKSDLSNKP